MFALSRKINVAIILCLDQLSDTHPCALLTLLCMLLNHLCIALLTLHIMYCTLLLTHALDFLSSVLFCLAMSFSLLHESSRAHLTCVHQLYSYTTLAILPLEQILSGYLSCCSHLHDTMLSTELSISQLHPTTSLPHGTSMSFRSLIACLQENWSIQLKLCHPYQHAASFKYATTYAIKSVDKLK